MHCQLCFARHWSHTIAVKHIKGRFAGPFFANQAAMGQVRCRGVVRSLQSEQADGCSIDVWIVHGSL
jgi:hypothetical protein